LPGDPGEPGVQDAASLMSMAPAPSPPPHLLEWLRVQGAGDTPHSGRTLLDHLANTYCILAASRQPASVCAAGLFHSVYGTNAFRCVTVAASRRNEVCALIGEEAERLAWLFGTIERPRAIIAGLRGEAIRPADVKEPVLDRAWIRKLAAIECANLLEQGELWQTEALVVYARRIGMVTDFGFAPVAHTWRKASA